MSGQSEKSVRRQVSGSIQRWTVTITPNGTAAVTVSLTATTDCGATGAICTSDNRPLSNSVTETVAGPIGISVADARVDEGPNAKLAFEVTLSRPASEEFSVGYRTSDGSGQAGAADYTAADGALQFGTGTETQRSMSRSSTTVTTNGRRR